MDVSGNYTGQDGQQQELRATFLGPGNGDPYRRLLTGMARMREMVNELLEAVQNPIEASDSEEEEEASDEEEEEEENNTAANNGNSEEPSAKRFKNST
ncbi:EKC/KEOPS complex subunit GON7 isoform X2 [Sorex fumeus]|uniref:EKC/KEOPS complex subunit GON7 isoform X2 n=1 Tax=Sorex fumeus TaxID=62283 RepID=UPI0024AD5101|nr:EKC/KEOPS complex subunit GON7 isoform X2 [Sorex fumeus]